MHVFRAALALAFAVLLAAPAQAADDAGLRAHLVALAAAKGSTKVAAATDIARSGHPAARRVLEAFRAGELYTVKADQSVVIATGRGKTLATSDPVSGEALGDAPKRSLKKVRVNNKLRRAVSGLIGGLDLYSDDPGRRLAGAQAAFGSADQALLPTIAQALEAEADATVRDALESSLASLRLRFAETQGERVEAIARLSLRSDGETVALLQAAADNEAFDTSVRAAATEAIGDIEQRQRLAAAAENLWFGLSLGSVLFLAAVGLAITFGVMGVINMAHGEMVMLGAYTTFVVQQVIRSVAPDLMNWSLAFALPLAFLVAGLVGIAIERGVIRFLYGRPLETLLATFGVSLVLQQTVRTLFGSTNQQVSNPDWMSGAVEIGALTLTWNRIWILVFALVVFVVLLVLMKRTWVGLHIRAVTQNRAMASSMGIATSRVDALTFGLGSGIAGIAGVALSQVSNVSPNLGQSYIVDSFMVVVFGGVGNLWGTLVGAMDARRRQQVHGTLCRGRARQDHRPGVHHRLHPVATARALRTARQGGRGMISRMLGRALGGWAWLVVMLLLALGVVLPYCNLVLPPESTWHVPDYLVSLFGKYLSFALLALALDLVWGYCGVLSLGHGAFFALGGYAMGMHLMREIGTRGRVRPSAAAGLHGVPQLGGAAVVLARLRPVLVRLPDGGPGARRPRLCLRLVRLPQPRHRRLPVDHHAGADLRTDARLLPQRDGLWRQQRPDRLQGHPRLRPAGVRDPRGAVQRDGRRARAWIHRLPRAGDFQARPGDRRHPGRREPHPLRRLPGRALQAVRMDILCLPRRHRRRAVRTAGGDHQSGRVRAGELDRGGRLGRGRDASRFIDYGFTRPDVFSRGPHQQFESIPAGDYIEPLPLGSPAPADEEVLEQSFEEPVAGVFESTASAPLSAANALEQPIRLQPLTSGATISPSDYTQPMTGANVVPAVLEPTPIAAPPMQTPVQPVTLPAPAPAPTNPFRTESPATESSTGAPLTSNLPAYESQPSHPTTAIAATTSIR